MVRDSRDRRFADGSVLTTAPRDRGAMTDLGRVADRSRKATAAHSLLESTEDASGEGPDPRYETNVSSWTSTPSRTPNAMTVLGSIRMAFESSESKYRTNPALDISPPVFCPLSILVSMRP
ncbi:hypothetical protein NJ7G_2863 [Natrinema sp. J7-2]|nr:hypothetical protein NJ7G_2863 [Natrinema sp. J7-2]